MFPDWVPLPNVQPIPQFNEDCLRAQAMQQFLNSNRGWGWIEEISKGLRLHPNLRSLLQSRISCLLMRGDRVAWIWVWLMLMSVCLPLSTPCGEMFGPVSCETPGPPVTLLLGLDPQVLDRGIGQVGHIPIREFIWDLLAPLDFPHVAASDLGTMPDISPEDVIMALALVRDVVLKPCGGGGPNGYLFPVPQNATKASMIVHLVPFIEQHQSKPHSFCLPFVDDLAFLVQVHSMLPPKFSMHSVYLSYLNDSFLSEVDSLRVQASGDEESVACHIDLTNVVWSLVLPQAPQGSCRVQIDG